MSTNVRTIVDKFGLADKYKTNDTALIVQKLHQENIKLQKELQTTRKNIGKFIYNSIMGPPANYFAVSIVDPHKILNDDHFKYDINVDAGEKYKKKYIYDKIPRSVTLLQLKSYIRSMYDSNAWTVESIHSYSNNKIKCIIDYLCINNCEGSLNPIITINSKQEKQTANIYKYLIKNSTNKNLEGQYGIKASKYIPKNTVIGQYIGIELTSNQFSYIHDLTESHVASNQYAFEASFGISLKKLLYSKSKNNFKIKNTPKRQIETEVFLSVDEKYDPPRKRRKISKIKYYKEEAEDEYKAENDISDLINKNGQIKIDKIIIDGLAARKVNKFNNLIIFINDPRNNLSKKKLNHAEQQKTNIVFHLVLVNGWPSVFAITSKDISKNDELLVDYGKKYSQNIQEEKQWKEDIKKECSAMKKKLQSCNIEIAEDKEYFMDKLASINN